MVVGQDDGGTRHLVADGSVVVVAAAEDAVQCEEVVVEVVVADVQEVRSKTEGADEAVREAHVKGR